MPQIVRDKEMDVSIEALFRSITDFESYPKFLPEVVAAKAHPMKGKNQQVDFEIEVIKKFQYSLIFEITEPGEIRWKLGESNFFKTNEGIWKLTAKGPTSTDVHYELDVNMGFFVPSWVTKKLTETSLPKMFDSFEERAKALGK